jgi:hypothetical protein
VAYSDGGNSWKATVMEFIIPPHQISNLTSTAGNSQVSLSWTISEDGGGTAITDHIIRYKAQGEENWTIFSHNPLTTNTITVGGLTNGTAYTFRVTSVNSYNIESAPIEGTVTPVAPTPIQIHHTSGSYIVRPKVIIPSPVITPPIINTNTTTNQNNTNTNTNNTLKITFTKNLSPKNKGAEVLKLQKLLKDLGYLKATPNGFYGPATKLAVKKYQKDHGIPSTGIVGPLTRKAMGGK